MKAQITPLILNLNSLSLALTDTIHQQYIPKRAHKILKRMMISLLIIGCFTKVSAQSKDYVELMNLPNQEIEEVEMYINSDLKYKLMSLLDQGYIYYSEYSKISMGDSTQVNLTISFPNDSLVQNGTSVIDSIQGGKYWLPYKNSTLKANWVEKSVITGYSPELLHKRSALILMQYIAVEILEGKKQGLSPSQQGAKSGEIFAAYKWRQTWDSNSWKLHFNSISKLIDPNYLIEFSPGELIIKSDYTGILENFKLYGLTKDDFLQWHLASHEVMGKVQGYTLSAHFEGNWYLEKYKQIPPLHLFKTLSELNIDNYPLRDVRQYKGKYYGEENTNEGLKRYEAKIIIDQGNLQFNFGLQHARLGPPLQLVAVGPDKFMLGYVEEESVKVMPGFEVTIEPSNGKLIFKRNKHLINMKKK